MSPRIMKNPMTSALSAGHGLVGVSAVALLPAVRVDAEELSGVAGTIRGPPPG
ncbi:MAG TPA: hypothetical protein VLO09_03725 [Ornithinimicrobium sp.]|nr:hypothetical protein [Ornithinimicrobium sp.]